MRRWMPLGWILLFTLTNVLPARAQANLAKALAELTALKSKVGSGDTRVRVDATHRVRLIALSLPDADVKLTAIGLLREPVGSSSDHIRMPAVYTIAEIANSTTDTKVKVAAINAFAEPLDSAQGEIRNATMDALNSIMRSTTDGGIASAAVAALRPPIRSGVNGVRMPAINALVQAVVGRQNSDASQAAMELLLEPLGSSAAIGGMEVRMMAVAAMEKIGMDAADIKAKSKAMGHLQVYADKSGWEPEARARARDAADRVLATISK